MRTNTARKDCNDYGRYLAASMFAQRNRDTLTVVSGLQAGLETMTSVNSPVDVMVIYNRPHRYIPHASQDVIVESMHSVDFEPDLQIGEDIISPFDTVFDTESDEKKLDELIGYAGTLKLSYASRLAARLRALADAAIEEAPDQSPMSIPSLQGLLRFLQGKEKIRYPDLTLSHNGNIRAQWSESKDRHLMVEFLDNGSARLVVFGPDPKNVGSTVRVSMNERIDHALSSVEQYRVREWVVE